MSEVSLLSDKLHKYGVLGAGIVKLDPSSMMRYARSLEQQAAGIRAGLSLVSSQQKLKTITPAGPSKELSEAIAAMARELQNPGTGQKLKREHILEILTETTRVQAIVAQEISTLARELAEPKNGKKKRKAFTFLEGHKKIQGLNLPKEPLEDHGISESVFQNLLMQYQDDDEVMLCATKLLHPAGKGDPENAKGISIDRIVEIHQFMVKEMDKVLQEFKQLKPDSRMSFTGKACETTAELIVSVAVEQQLSVRCEDVEQAVIMHDEALQQHPEFARCTEMLAFMMQLLVSSTQDLISKTEFLAILRHMAESAKSARVFAKKLYEDYRSKSSKEDFIVEAYQRFEEFSEQPMAPAPDLPELNSAEMQLCFDEYRDDSAIRQAWEQSGAEANVAIQSMMASSMQSAAGAQSGGARASSMPEDKKGRKLKPSEIVEMQELMVDELKRIYEATALAAKKDGTSQSWNPELLTQMVQALASGAVERRYAVSGEEMAMMGFQHAATLQRNERFVRATEKQQEILMHQIPQLCAAS